MPSGEAPTGIAAASDAKPVLPALRKSTVTEPPLRLVMARSGRPSPLKSAATMSRGVAPVGLVPSKREAAAPVAQVGDDVGVAVVARRGDVRAPVAVEVGGGDGARAADGQRRARDEATARLAEQTLTVPSTEVLRGDVREAVAVEVGDDPVAGAEAGRERASPPRPRSRAGPRRKTERLLPVPLTVAASVRPSRLKSAVRTPYGWAAPTASGDPSGANDACAGAVMTRAPSAAIPGRNLLMRASSTAGRLRAIDKTYSTVEHGRIGAVAARSRRQRREGRRSATILPRFAGLS